MKVSLGADHAGFELKGRLSSLLTSLGHTVVDHGTDSAESVDYPDFAGLVAHDVASGNADRGLLVCGTGIGMAIAANKVNGARAANPASVEEAILSREHNDANVLCIGARFVDATVAEKILEAWLNSRFEGGRHIRRVEKIAAIEDREADERRPGTLEREFAGIEADADGSI